MYSEFFRKKFCFAKTGQKLGRGLVRSASGVWNLHAEAIVFISYELVFEVCQKFEFAHESHGKCLHVLVIFFLGSRGNDGCFVFANAGCVSDNDGDEKSVTKEGAHLQEQVNKEIYIHTHGKKHTK